MKFDCSYTGPSGLTVSLSVSNPESFLRSGSADQLSIYDSCELQDVLLQSLPAISQQLAEEYGKVSQVLLCSSIALNKKICDDIMQPATTKDAA